MPGYRCFLPLLLGCCLLVVVTAGSSAQDAYSDAMNAGRQALLNHDFKGSHDAYMQAAGQAPNADARAQAWNLAARALTRDDKLTEAAGPYQRIVDDAEASPTWKAKALEQLAYLHLRQKEMTKASEAFMAIMKVEGLDDDRIAAARLRLADIIAGENRQEEAETHYRAVFEDARIDPGQRARAAWSLAELALATEDVAAARAYYEQVHEFDWEPVHFYTQTQLKMGDTWATEGNPEAARREYAKVLDYPRARPVDKSIALFKIAESYEGEGKTAEAIAHYERVVGMDEAHGNYLRHATERLEQLKQQAPAEAEALP